MNSQLFHKIETGSCRPTTMVVRIVRHRDEQGLHTNSGMQGRSIELQQLLQTGLDIAASLVLLVLLSPLFLLIGVVVKLDSPGPVFFKQKRVGLDGRQFWFYKFRSMCTDAELQRTALLTANEASGPLFKMKNDPRITRSGRFIRKYSLDELPQIINVLKGDMSLVGPRPALPAEVAQYDDVARRRLAVKPGITGLWQVSGRSDLSFSESIELDLRYIAQQSVALYVIILLKTLPAVVAGRGAY